MNRKEFLEILIPYLKEDCFFDDFKFRKSDSSFIRKSKDPKGWYQVEIRNWESFGDDGDELSVDLGYGIRLDKYHTWYDEYNFKCPADRRACDTVAFSNTKLPTNKPWMYYLPYKSLRSDAILSEFREDIVENAKYVLVNYSTEKSIYQNLVYPILQTDNSKLGVGIGADWIFVYLGLAWVVDPENYEQIKKVVLDRVEFLHTVQNNPNIAHYYDKMSEIVEKLESGALD